MAFHVFNYPIPAPDPLEELNAFLQAHRVASVQHHIVTTPNGSWVVFVVETLEPTARGRGRRERSPASESVDYRKELDPDAFALFTELRATRKRLAQNQEIPVYAVFSNADLAAIARTAPRTVEELAKIEGIAARRIEKYGAQIIAVVEGTNPASSESDS